MPKGASAKVSQTGERIAREQGVEALDNFAKLHFKTYKEIKEKYNPNCRNLPVL